MIKRTFLYMCNFHRLLYIYFMHNNFCNNVIILYRKFDTRFDMSTVAT